MASCLSGADGVVVGGKKAVAASVGTPWMSTLEPLGITRIARQLTDMPRRTRPSWHHSPRAGAGSEAFLTHAYFNSNKSATTLRLRSERRRPGGTRAICMRRYRFLDTLGALAGSCWAEFGDRSFECKPVPRLVLHSTDTVFERRPVRRRSTQPPQQLELQYVSWEHPFLPSKI
jgi:hypothetical protein